MGFPYLAANTMCNEWYDPVLIRRVSTSLTIGWGLLSFLCLPFLNGLGTVHVLPLWPRGES